MLRVVFAVDNLNVGGTELNAFRTAKALHGRYADVSIMAMRSQGPLLEQYHDAGIEVRTYPVTSLLGPRTWRRQSQVYAFLRRARPDVFHSHDKYTNIFGLPIARAARVPAVIGSRRWNQSDDGRALALANRMAYTFADTVLFNSDRLQHLVGAREHIPPSRRAVVPNFLEPAAFERPSELILGGWRDELSLDTGVPIIGAVANLRPIKDHATLLAAADLLARNGFEFRLVLVGAGDQAELRKRSQELGLSRIVCFGGPRPPRPSFHYLFDISVLTSLSEGSSNSILEAMAAGRPVVATNVGGIPDAVRSDVTGILVPPRAPEALASALGRLIVDSELRGRLGANARRTALTQYAEAPVILRLLKLYDSLVARGPIRS